MVKLLVTKFKDQIDINKTDHKRQTALYWCCKKDNLEMTKLLIDNFKTQIDINIKKINNKIKVHFIKPLPEIILV